MSPTTGKLRFAIFVQLRRINVHMNNRAGLAKFLELAGHAIIEAHAKCEQQIRAVLSTSPSGR